MRTYKLVINHFQYGVIEAITSMYEAFYTLEPDFVLNAFCEDVNDHVVFSVSDVFVYEVL